jgi:hypothetical protein
MMRSIIFFLEHFCKPIHFKYFSSYFFIKKVILQNFDICINFYIDLYYDVVCLIG